MQLHLGRLTVAFTFSIGKTAKKVKKAVTTKGGDGGFSFNERVVSGTDG